MRRVSARGQWVVVLGVVAALLALWARPAGAQRTVIVVAGFPGWDHGMPWMAIHKGIYDKYGIKVDLQAGSYPRAVQIVQSGRWDAAYFQVGQAIQFYDKGVPLVIAAATAYGAATVLVTPGINAAKDLVGKKYGVITPFDGMHIIFREHVLPAHGLKPDDMTPVPVPIPEAALALKRGDIAAYYIFEPQATMTERQGAKTLWDWREVYKDGKIHRNSLILHRNFVKENPDLARRVVHAHMAAKEFIRERGPEADEIMAKESKIPLELQRIAREKSGWDREIVPCDWIDETVEDLLRLKLIKKKYTCAELTDYSLHEGYRK